jgi:4-hydroxy-3-methylbut-2-en-1-yl diphosphate reductase
MKLETSTTPVIYRSELIKINKELRKKEDPRKKDFSPTELIRKGCTIYLARHFGFCFGVENAVDIAYRALEEKGDKRIFLLSEMIHNPTVNQDLLSRGARFLMDTTGNRLINFSELTPEDVIILPAFGIPLELEQELKELDVDIAKYNTTCPFVERVWRRAEQLGENGFTIIIHGKPYHEETRATFSRSSITSPSIVVRTIEDTIKLCSYISGEKDLTDFKVEFKEVISKDFDPLIHLSKIGVVNQTTMLAEETKNVSALVKEALEKKFGKLNISDHFADTRDTLCYATSDNQKSVLGLLKTSADFSIVVGGFNSSNTCHLAKLCASKFITYHISGINDLKSISEIRYRDPNDGTMKTGNNWLHKKSAKQINIALTAGASTPDSIVHEIIARLEELVG